jgi:hypothetical protein
LAIDVGLEAIDRTSSYWMSRTYVALDNPANAAGSIDTVEIYLNNSTDSVTAGMFYLVSGTTYKVRDSESIGDIAGGSKQVVTGLDIDCESGDLIGAYSPNYFYLDINTSGYSGIRYYNGECIDPGDEQSFSLNDGDGMSLYGTGASGGGATEKFGADTGAGAEAKASGSPSAAVSGSETGAGTDSLPSRDIILPESGTGVDAFVSLQTPAAKTASDTGYGVDVSVSLEVPVAKNSSDIGSGVEGMPVSAAVLVGSESGSGIEAFIARLLAAAESGYGAEASEIGGGGLLKHLFASELGEGADGLTAKIEIPTKGGGMRLWI